MWASRSLPGATASSGPEVSTDFMSMTFLNPEPRLITWNPPESVNVGPDQFMNAPSPPASSRMSAPGWRYRW